MQSYPGGFGEQFVYATSQHHALQKGGGCAGETDVDPIGATFGQVYRGSANYVLWNDQFYGDPIATRAAPWGHSKGLLAWNSEGEGFVMQVSTPSWPGSGSRASPRHTDGNTLGCVTDNDVMVSQHFFALRLTKADVLKVLAAMENASVVTDTTKRQIVKNGGPADVQDLVRHLGKLSASNAVTAATLSTGVRLLSKASGLHVPPWQLVSAQLGGVALRAATWWAAPKIASTTATTTVGCWESGLGTPGAVENAMTGHWEGQTFGLTGGAGANFNHAKIGISTSGAHNYTVFGDLNQQGSLSGPNCLSSQNGRGGLFYVLEDDTLFRSVRSLIRATSSPTP